MEQKRSWSFFTVSPPNVVVVVVRRIHPVQRRQSFLLRKHLSSTYRDNNDNDSIRRELKSIQEQQRRDALVDAVFFGPNKGNSPSSTSSLRPIYLVGQARLSVMTNRTKSLSNMERIALVLTGDRLDPALTATTATTTTTTTTGVLLPLASKAQLKLIAFAVAGRRLSQSVLLTLNTLFVNRDNALFDNLPWSTWSVDPQRRNYDAAGNPIAEKFHLGKRDAYNRFLGKDWQGRSLAIGNIALRLKYMLEKEEKEEEVMGTTTNDDNDDTTGIILDEEESQNVLATRMLELYLRELRMELADIESQLAIARNNQGPVMALEEDQREMLKSIASAEEDLSKLLEQSSQGSSSSSSFSGIAKMMDRIADWTTENGKNRAPYRGAMGYAPMLDSKKDIEDSLLPYTNPYDLLKEILEDQLNARVLTCLLENTSLLNGNLALGGAVILQRITPQKKTTIARETFEYNDYDEDFGNEGLKAGETILVECDADEAMGVSLACNVPLKMETSIFEQASILVEQSKTDEDIMSMSSSKKNIIEFLSMYRTVDRDMNFQMEGEASLSTSSNPISIPQTTTSLFDTMFEEKPPSSSSLFPVDNPIRSLTELDQLSNNVKAKMLLEMSNFSGRLPRPRVLRISSSQGKTNPLDQLLLPLIDESVRRQYYIRDAEAKGDMELATRLRAEKSQRQLAKEEAEKALEEGRRDVFDQWETEAEFLETLRADVTQDEGAYSRFLDRDYWYEKDRQTTAKRVDRSKFGNLLDGIE